MQRVCVWGGGCQQHRACLAPRIDSYRKLNRMTVPGIASADAIPGSVLQSTVRSWASASWVQTKTW